MKHRIGDRRIADRIATVEKSCAKFEQWSKSTNGDVQDIKTDLRELRTYVQTRFDTIHTENTRIYVMIFIAMALFVADLAIKYI